MPNIFDLPSQLPNEELFETLISNQDLLVERIISTFHHVFGWQFMPNSISSSQEKVKSQDLVSYLLLVTCYLLLVTRYSLLVTYSS